MFKYAVAILAVLVTLPVAHAGGNQTNSSYSLTHSRGGYFAISGCFRSWSSAKKRARRIGARAFNTSRYPNFRRGYKCAGYGPSSYWGAKGQCAGLREDGYSCYVKNGWKRG